MCSAVGDVGITVGDLVRQHRRAAGLTQQELARQARLSVRAVRDIERNRVAQPRDRTVQRLATALGLDRAARDRLLSAVDGAVPVGPLEIGVLGPLLVRRGTHRIDLGSAKQRDLLGLLAVQPEQVSIVELVDGLWEHRPPRTAAALVHTYVARLRARLETPGAPRVLVAGTGGYRLRLPPDRLDLARFDALLDEARDRPAADRFALLGAALRLWRGPVVADLGSGVSQHPAAVAAGRRRLATALAYADLAAELGQPAEAADRLRDLARDEPLDESVYARLVRALGDAGQQASALHAYAEVRERLVDELGVEPGAELQAAQLAVLRQSTVDSPESTVTRVPEQLVGDIRGFTGRERHLRRLHALLPADGPPAVPVLAVITGTAGVGKSALAVHWAHRVRDRFPDGQLYVDLHGYAPSEPLRPIQALALFLPALGVLVDRVPVDPTEAAALYRTMLAGRRVLVVLDNAATADQVRPLLPGTPGGVVLVTSRDRLVGLTARDGAQPIALDVLAPAEAVALLDGLLTDRVAPREELAELAGACAYLPLALRIAAAQLIGSPHQTVRAFVAELGEAGSAALHADADTAVGTAFGYSYRRLPLDARRMFRLLGLLPGPDCTLDAAAALAGTDPALARPVVSTLSAAHLLTEHARGRFSFHDLLRRYARERAEAEDGAADRAAALARLYDWYLTAVDAAARELYPEKVRVPYAPSTVYSFADHREALAWLEAERHTLAAAVRYAARTGLAGPAWRLADQLRGYYWTRVYLVDWLAVAQDGMAAATADGDPVALASAHLNLAGVYHRRGRYREAISRYRRVIPLAEQVGWVDGYTGAVDNLGSVYRQLGQLNQAVELHRRALAGCRRTGDLAGQATALDNLANAYHELGELRRAATHHSRALILHRQIGDRRAEAVDRTNLGDNLLALGRREEALRLLDEALLMHRELGDRGGEAETLRLLAEAHRLAGRLPAALDLAGAALAIAHDTGDRRFEADALNTLATVHCGLDEPERAVDRYLTALRLAGETESRPPEAMALVGLAVAHQLLGRTPEAIRYAERALAVADGAGLRMLAAQAHEALRRIGDPMVRPAPGGAHTESC